MPQNSLGLRLRRIKDDHFAKAKPLAEALGLKSAGYLSELISGKKTDLGREHAENLRRFLANKTPPVSLDVEWLLKGTGEPPWGRDQEIKETAPPYSTPRAALAPILADQFETPELHARLKELAAFCTHPQTQLLVGTARSTLHFGLANISRICNELLSRERADDAVGRTEVETKASGD